MTIPLRPLVLLVAASALSLVLFNRAQAGGKHFFSPVADPVVKEECGACHLPYAPSMLPARSWQRLMGQLDKHFGDDASLAPETAQRITDYLVANAADTGGERFGTRLLHGVGNESTPLRITELPRWMREHRKVSDQEWRSKKVGTKANCAACHTDAERGYYDE